ncbi:MAG: asparagine synthase (glutamine-hydrolyzing), partial [Bacteroidota bacterium]
MCGIVGIVRPHGQVQQDDVRAMANQIVHRGPDGEGYYAHQAVGLGHRRLSIIDPTLGHQPMYLPERNLAIVYNGELYNFREIRKALEQKGHQFATQSDTEVVLHAYLEWGTACVKHFRGMFAFAIDDPENHRVFIARDPLGIKPLYLYQTTDGLYFASEIQALSTLPKFDDALDAEAMDAYLKYQYIPQPSTVFQRVSSLLPGHLCVVNTQDGNKHTERYWSVRYQPQALSEADWLEKLEEAFKASVEAHLVSDVPFGAFLSGGVDSTLVVSYMV